ncbi:MAG: fasciclin domain-containing protein [Xanthomonadaceae bacterium]|nr:fasciclin domain-containing protein [Xanthomonadaceae bacterium]MDE2497536.1 fasciclin domain-containing protein [Xanthomonadaceae bacterium]
MKTRNTVSALALGLSLALAISTPPAFAQMSSGMGSMGPEQTVMVGGAAMYPSRNIVQNAIHSKDHTTLVAAVKAAGLVKTLEGPGPFTVFAPTNGAFDALPAVTVQTLLKPENKAQLTKILTYHVVPGRLDTKTLDAKIAAGGGEAKLKTVEGDWLTVKGSGTRLTVTDDKGNTADITIPNVYQSNGVIMVINKVLMP